MSGFIIGPILLGYLIFSYIVFGIVLKTTQKKKLSYLVLVGVLTFPFWDLIVQKTIKTGYQVSGALNPEIYEYPEKD